MNSTRSLLVKWVLGLLSLVLLTYALAVTALGAGAVPGRSGAEQRAVAYSQLNRDVSRAMTDFLSMDYTRFDEVVRRVRQQATGPFAKEYAANVGDLEATATRSRARATGRVRSIGIGEVDGAAATVYVAADSVVANTSTVGVKKTAGCPYSGKVCRQYRFKLSMHRLGGQWKIAGLELVS